MLRLSPPPPFCPLLTRPLSLACVHRNGRGRVGQARDRPLLEDDINVFLERQQAKVCRRERQRDWGASTTRCCRAADGRDAGRERARRCACLGTAWCWMRARAGVEPDPQPHTLSPPLPPPNPRPPVRSAPRRSVSLSPARLAGEHVGPSSIGAIARAMPMRTTRDAHRYNNNNNITNSAEETRSERLKNSPQFCS